ncbi:hypothetical protein FOFC_02734 [Fusarium oxysporum]|nr:hypothetical protein FOFC_02734 [Fusarium oxysporum]
MRQDVGKAETTCNHGNGWAAGRVSKERDNKAMTWDRKICSRSLQWPVLPRDEGVE